MHESVVIVDPGAAGIRRAVGSEAYETGVRLASSGAVVGVEWCCDDRCSVFGFVWDTDPAVPYETVVHFVPGPDGRPRYDGGACSCRVGVDCEHAAALALIAAAEPGGADQPVPLPRQLEPPSWEASLGDLLGDPIGVDRPVGTPLAVELELWTPTLLRSASGRVLGAPDVGLMLSARLLRPGSTGWKRSGVSWSSLDAMQRQGEYRPTEVRLMQDLFALLRGSDPSSPYSAFSAPGCGEVVTLDLAAIDSVALWGLLDQAAELGVPLMHRGAEVGTFGEHAEADLVLDVTGGAHAATGLQVTPVLRVEGVDAAVVPVRFVGADGHGLVYVTAVEALGVRRPATWRPRLARLRRSVPLALRRMALEGRAVEVPRTERDRFRDEFSPRLRDRAVLVSSDGSFESPSISAPTLVLRAGYGGDHEVMLSWEWAYEIGETRLRAPVARPGIRDVYRDATSERAVVDAIDLPLRQYGLHPDRTDAAAPTRLRGLETVRFTTEILPGLWESPGVDVEIVGELLDYREAGDSLQVGVSTEQVEGDPDWFDLGIRITVEGREIPFGAVFVALAEGRSHLLLPDGAYFSLARPELETLRRLIEEARALQEGPDGRPRLSRYQAGLWDELTEVAVVEHQAAAWHQQVAGLLALDDQDAAEVPSTLCGELRPYQRDGFTWLAFLWRAGLGGVLADDMGLGKTVQTLALICHARQVDPTGAPFLIVAPTSVVPNWVAEAARFAPHLKVTLVAETLRRRDRDAGDVVAGADVVVMSYALFRLDAAAYRSQSWSGLILDEAQVVKNHRSRIHQCARELPAPFKLAITGTPMENNLMELWALLAVTAPGLFPRAGRFREDYARPIERQRNGERLARLRRRIRPLMKRRTKELVAADLPAKQEQVLEVDLDPKHRTIYQRHLQRERQKILGLLDDVEGNRFLILRSLTLLRRLSLHAAFVDAEHADVPSSKIDTLLAQLDDVIGGGHRALVFSQFTGYLGHVRARLESAGITYCYLDGGTRDRESVIRAFKEGGVPVFLISLKAGGSGLNLPEADYCFLLDPWWNPATEAQAVDRAHRIGQTRTVMVYRLVAKGTIEEKVMALKARKATLFAGVMGEGDAFGSSLDADDIRELFR